MKKVLLSLTVLAASFAANAQQTAIYGGPTDNNQDAVNSANGWASYEADANQTVPPTWVNTEVTETSGNVYLKLAGTDTDENSGVAGGNYYFIWGASNGRYSDLGNAESFGFTGTSTGYISFRVKFIGQYTEKVGINLKTTGGTEYEYEFARGAGALNTWIVASIPFSSFDLVGAGTGAPSTADVQSFSQIGLNLLVNACNWNGTACVDEYRSAEIHIDDIYFSASQLTTIPSIPLANKAANISSSVVFPNPSSDAVYANLNLKSANDVTVVVTDLMGRQVATKAFGRVSEINNAEIFNAASLAKGMYTVTYVLDGTPSKSDLVVVK